MTNDIASLVSAMTVGEKAALTAGGDLWSTAGLTRLGIPKVRLTDGPSGARGEHLGPTGPTAACVPCGSALGATWNPALVEQVGELLGRETRSKRARVLLAPTVNLHRSPLSGRNFECYSEDPVLSGVLAAALVHGVQSQGVVATVKHLVGNEAEHLRYSSSSVIDERALREIYLVPFELAIRRGGALGLMCAYNRLNGHWPTERDDLLDGIVRGEWGFEGFVVSDWYGVLDTVSSARAGVDLEMPGPARSFGAALAEAVRAGKVPEHHVDAQVTHQLRAFDRVGALDDSATAAPDDGPHDLPSDPELLRRAACEAMVLLRNDGLLPLDASTCASLAVIGPNADRAQIVGGGSAAVRPHRVVTPLAALRDHVGERVRVLHARGCDNAKTTPALGGLETAAPSGAGPGFDLELHADPDLGGEPVERRYHGAGELFFMEPPVPGLPRTGWSFRARTRLTPSEAGTFTFTLVQGGWARLIVDGTTVIDGFGASLPRGDAFYGLGSTEQEAEVSLRAGVAVDVVVEYSTTPQGPLAALKVGLRRPSPPDLMDRAVDVARQADAAVLVVGTDDDWESEGYDRSAMDLPGRQDELVRRVLAANPDTVVVVNAASPVTMDWAEDARAVLQVWFGGQEMADGLAEVLFGEAEPGGRLPTTLPRRIQDTPAYGNFPGENNEVRYAEGLFVGYRWYEERGLPTQFPFGHGLSYSTFALGEPVLSDRTFRRGGSLVVEVPVTNTGARTGSEVVQCYVSHRRSRLQRPPKELRAFAKVRLEPGASTTARLVLDDRAFAYWDPGQPDWETVAARFTELPMSPGPTPRPPGWQVDPGDYRLHIGRSSADIAYSLDLQVAADPA